jgi:two-component system response regulator NreC
MAGSKAKIRVLIADDHAILRSGLKLLVDAQIDMEVVAEAADGKQAVDKAKETTPDVALIDLSMPRSGGMDALQKIITPGGKTRVVVLTMYDDPAYLRSALAAGASGYVLKRSVDGDLLSAIRAVHRGGIFIDPSLAKVLVQDVLTTKGAKNIQGQPAKLLSDREMQVLRLVARGYSSKQIAGQIFVSAKTVETYRSRLLEKLGLTSRSDLVRYAVHTGLLSAEAIDK